MGVLRGRGDPVDRSNFFAVAGRIRTRVRLLRFVPRVEGFSEFLKNALTGLTVQSLVVVVSLQLVFEVAVVRYLARGFPLLSRVVVGDIPEFRCTPPVPVKRFLYLCVVEDFHSMGSVDFQHSERLYNDLYPIQYERLVFENGGISRPAIGGGCRGVVGFIPRLKTRVFSSNCTTRTDVLKPDRAL